MLDFFKKSEVAFAIGMIILMGILMVPIPTFLMDIFLSISLTLSILVFFTSLFVEKPLDFNTFPTVLLVLTLFRLALNVASTRLILGRGHEGTAAAGHVIEAFGQLVMSGNFVIGLIVFAILIIINFVVITKGSGRIAEVSARFSLDAMPGKQMAIDAELSSGAINDTQARIRRKMLEAESSFYGSMDGASKFVRGDAIAGLLITFINIIGGIIIGVAQMGLSFQDASRTYTLLTVGDGLVAQIPALIISTAAGLIITKSGDEERTDQAFFRQLGHHPLPFILCSALTGIFAVLPGMPILPFVLLSGGSGFWAYHLSKNPEKKEADSTKDVVSSSAQGENSVTSPLAMDLIRLEFGSGLIGLMPKITEQIKSLRLQFQKELGVTIPSLRLQDRFTTHTNSYTIFIKEIKIATGAVQPQSLLVMHQQGEDIPLEGQKTKEPTFGLDAMWIAPSLRREAERLRLTIVEPSTVLMTHVSETLKDHIAEFLNFSHVQGILDELSEPYKRLLNDIVPGQLSITQIQKILQGLVHERVSIRDMTSILEAIADACTYSRSIPLIIEHVRSRLSRQITFSNFDPSGQLNILTLSFDIEQKIQESLVGEGEQKQFAISPSSAQDIVRQIFEKVDIMTMQGEQPIVLTTPMSRPYIRFLTEKMRPSLVIMSQNELDPKAKIKNLGTIG